MSGVPSRTTLVVALVTSAVAVVVTAALCVAPWRVAWLLGIGIAWVAPGIIAMYRAYRECRRGRLAMALLLGPALGYASSSLGLLAVWVAGGRSGLWLVGVPAVVGTLAWYAPSMGSRLDVPRYGRRDLLAVALLVLMVPLVVARPYSQVGADLPEGRAYRAYFTADFVWAMAVVSEVSKGDVLPANPYHVDMPLHYYWVAHLLPALEHRTLGREVRLDHLLLANAVFSGVLFIGFLYAMGKQVARGAAATSLGCVLTVLCTSPEGVAALSELWWHDRPLSLVRYLNIDAISRWRLGALPIDGLQRLLMYQPQHQLGYALAGASLLVMVQQWRHPSIRAAAWCGVLLGCGLLISTFSALMVAVMLVGLAGSSIARARAWRTGLLQAGAASVPLVAAVWLSRLLAYVASDGTPLITVGPNPMAVRHALSGLALSFGPVLVALLLGGWWAWRRGGAVRERFLLPAVALLVCLLFYFFVDVRDHQDVYVGWRAGHLIFIVCSGALGWTWWRVVHASARRVRAVGIASLAGVVLLTAPTSAIDLYNSQDLTNRAMAAGFPWTLVLGHDEVSALQWIANNTPLDARVQVEPLARDPGTWAYITAFGERRMAAGLPISMIPLAPYERISRRVSRMYELEDANAVFLEARALRIDVLVVGPEERKRHPAFLNLVDQHPALFAPLFRTRNITIYAVSGRMRSWGSARHP